MVDGHEEGAASLAIVGDNLNLTVGYWLLHPNQPASSSGPGHHPFKVKITGSNPVAGTTPPRRQTASSAANNVVPAVLCR